MDHYFDDFIFVGEGDMENCAKLMHCFKHLIAESGVPLAEDKTAGPTIRIPQHKVDSLIQIVINFVGRKKVTLKDLQSLAGMLNIFGRANRCSRVFNRRSYDFMSEALKPYHHIRFTSDINFDLRIWLKFLQGCNGVSYFPDSEWQDLNTLNCFTDSADSHILRCGLIFKEVVFFFSYGQLGGKIRKFLKIYVLYR